MSRTRRPLVLLAATATLLAPASLAAQGGDAERIVAPGSHVRVRLAPPPDAAPAGPSRRAGSLLRIDADSVVMRSGGDTVAVPRAWVSRLDVRTGERSRSGMVLRRAALGAAIAAGAGAVLGYAFYEPCEGEFLCYSRTGEAAMTGVVWAIPGTLAGGIWGAMSDREEWRPVPLAPTMRVGLAVTSRSAAISIRF